MAEPLFHVAEAADWDAARRCGRYDRSTRGRSLEDVLADAYVVNRSTPEQRARVLERPEIVEAIGDHTLEAMRRSLAGEGTAAGR